MNVHDIQMFFVEMTFYVYVCFVECYMFVSVKIHVVGPILVYEKIWG